MTRVLCSRFHDCVWSEQEDSVRLDQAVTEVLTHFVGCCRLERTFMVFLVSIQHAEAAPVSGVLACFAGFWCYRAVGGMPELFMAGCEESFVETVGACQAPSFLFCTNRNAAAARCVQSP